MLVVSYVALRKTDKIRLPTSVPTDPLTTTNNNFWWKTEVKVLYCLYMRLTPLYPPCFFFHFFTERTWSHFQRLVEPQLGSKSADICWTTANNYLLKYSPASSSTKHPKINIAKAMFSFVYLLLWHRHKDVKAQIKTVKNEKSMFPPSKSCFYIILPHNPINNSYLGTLQTPISLQASGQCRQRDPYVHIRLWHLSKDVYGADDIYAEIWMRKQEPCS